jgi:hypothetical protein
MAADVVRFTHRRTSEGVTVEASFTGAWQPRIVLAVVAAVVLSVSRWALTRTAEDRVCVSPFANVASYRPALSPSSAVR